MSASKNRQSFIVDPDVQWSLARRVMLHWGMFLVAASGICTALEMMLSVPDRTMAQALEASMVRQVPMVMVFAVLLPLFLRDTFRLSNRFAGPMLRLRMQMHELSEGRATQPLSFRDGDFWHAAAEDFNQLRERVADLERKSGVRPAEPATAPTSVVAPVTPPTTTPQNVAV
jgi:hypothetical protein